MVDIDAEMSPNIIKNMYDGVVTNARVCGDLTNDLLDCIKDSCLL